MKIYLVILMAVLLSLTAPSVLALSAQTTKSSGAVAATIDLALANELTESQLRSQANKAKLESQIAQMTAKNQPFPYLKYSSACSPDEDIQILAVGDILLHGLLQIQATKHPLRYKSLWSSLIPLIESADISYANLEGPVAPNTIIGGE